MTTQKDFDNENSREEFLKNFLLSLDSLEEEFKKENLDIEDRMKENFWEDATKQDIENFPRFFVYMSLVEEFFETPELKKDYSEDEVEDMKDYLWEEIWVELFESLSDDFKVKFFDNIATMMVDEEWEDGCCGDHSCGCEHGNKK